MFSSHHIKYICSDFALWISNSTVVQFSRDPPKSGAPPKTATHKNHPKNISSEEKHAHGIVLIKTTK